MAVCCFNSLIALYSVIKRGRNISVFFGKVTQKSNGIKIGGRVEA